MTTKNKKNKKSTFRQQNSLSVIAQKQSFKGESLYDAIIPGREFESLLAIQVTGVDIRAEMRKAISEIERARNKPTICYLANVVNPNIKAPISIHPNDDLPFSEMLSQIKENKKEIDIILVTPGGSAEQVAKFVDRLRPRFEKVTFILPNICMSAGSIFVMSGNEIIMDSRAYIGPIDPQIPNRDGQYVPAQAILTLIEDIRKQGEELVKKGLKPYWTDMMILNKIDAKEIGNALNASRYSIELVENFLYKYKFETWNNHANNSPVTDDEKKKRAKEIADILCNHGLWKTHGRGINRQIAWDDCKLKIVYPEDIPGLKTALRKFWALCYWIFDHTPIYKMYISNDYCIFKNVVQTQKGK